MKKGKKINKIMSIKKSKETKERSSSSSNGPEDFDWVNDEDNKNKMLQFSNFPMSYWKTIIEDGDAKDKSPEQIKPGTFHHEIINTILQNDIFEGLKFRADTLKYKPMKTEEISPDFYIENIDPELFANIIKERSYMFRMNYIIPSTIKKINIIGEIKSSKSGLSDLKQKNGYIDFAKKNTTKEILYFVMYILDHSFRDFYSANPSKSLPIIYGYIPKVYKEDTYSTFQTILSKLNLKDKSFDQKTKEELALIKENKEKKYNSDILFYKTSCIIFMILFFILLFFNIFLTLKNYIF